MTHTVEEVSKLQGNRDWSNTVTLLCGTRCDSIALYLIHFTALILSPGRCGLHSVFVKQIARVSLLRLFSFSR